MLGQASVEQCAVWQEESYATYSGGRGKLCREAFSEGREVMRRTVVVVCCSVQSGEGNV